MTCELCRGKLGLEATVATKCVISVLQGKALASAMEMSLAELSPLALQAIGGMAAAAKTDSKKIADGSQGQAGSADVQKRSVSVVVPGCFQRKKGHDGLQGLSRLISP